MIAEKKKKRSEELRARSKQDDSILGKKLHNRESLLSQVGEVTGFIEEVIDMRNKNNLYDQAHHGQMASFDKIKILHNLDAANSMRFKR